MSTTITEQSLTQGLTDVRDFIRKKHKVAFTQTKGTSAAMEAEERQQRIDEASLKYHFLMRDPYLAVGVHSPHALGQWDQLYEEASSNLTPEERNLFPAPEKVEQEGEMSLAQEIMYRSAKQAIRCYSNNTDFYDAAVRTNREYMNK